MASRVQNERKFKDWQDLLNGGRRYVREFVGRAGGRARYMMQTNAEFDLRRKFMMRADVW
jgi:hypothetical protein